MVAPEEETSTIGSAKAVTGEKNSAAQFVARFTSHFQTCVLLAKRLTGDNPDLRDSAAISQLCRASQEMLEQAKEARTLTEIYLALDEDHRDTVRPIITARFTDIAKLARASWSRFCDSLRMTLTPKPEIESAQRDFRTHAEKFQQALRAFIEMSAETS